MQKLNCFMLAGSFDKRNFPSCNKNPKTNPISIYILAILSPSPTPAPHNQVAGSWASLCSIVKPIGCENKETTSRKSPSAMPCILKLEAPKCAIFEFLQDYRPPKQSTRPIVKHPRACIGNNHCILK